MKYDVFISYRREGGYDTAKHLNDLLVRDGYKVSFDIDTLRSGDFDTQLLERIDQCKDFILIVDQHAFDRTLDPNFNPKNDWLRCELAYALKKNKNIVPVFISGVTGFPANLPNDVAEVVKKNGPEFNRSYFDAFYKELKKRFLKSTPCKRILTYVLFFILAIFVSILIYSLFYGNETINIKKQQSDSIAVEDYNDLDSVVDSVTHAKFSDISFNLSIENFRAALEDKGYVLGGKYPKVKMMSFYNVFEALWVYYDALTNKVWLVINIDLHFDLEEDGFDKFWNEIVPELTKEYKAELHGFCDGVDCIDIPGGVIIPTYDEERGPLIMTIDERNSNNYDNLLDATYGVSPYGIEKEPE